MPWRESAAQLESARAERPLILPGPDGALSGVYTPPAPGAPAAGLCVLWLSLPRAHRNRTWIEGARRLAARGFASFRFDYHGHGDSGGATDRHDPNLPYQGDVLAVIRGLRERLGERRFLLFGSCFDARSALSAFDGEADAIEGLFFMSAPVMEMEDLVRADADRKDWTHMARALGNPENWRSLKDPERWKYMATVLGRVTRRSVGAESGGPPLSAGFLDHFGALVRSRARALFFYGREDREYESFREAERTLWPALPPEAARRLTIELWEGKVHDGVLDMHRQREIVERVLSWMESFHPGSGAPAEEHAAAAAPAASRNGSREPIR